MNIALSLVTSNPLVTLYLLQGLTDAAAAALYRKANHNELRLCYLLSAFLHWGFGACHLMNLG